MTRFAHLAWLLAAVSLMHADRAGDQSAPTPPPEPWVRLGITSTALHDNRELLVARPDGYATSTRSYPVLLLLDANDAPQFRSAASLGMSDTLPEAYIREYADGVSMSQPAR